MLGKVVDMADLTEEQYEKALHKLKGKDLFGVSGDATSTLMAGVAGASASGVLASAAGATTFMGSTMLGSAVGGVLVTTTPVGWVVGCTAAACAIGYGATRAIRSGERQDITRQSMRGKIGGKLSALRAKKKASVDELPALPELIDKALSLGVIQPDFAERLTSLVESQAMQQEVAISRLQAVMASKVTQD